MRKKLLYIGGSITACFVVFHLLFWNLFNWQTELIKLSPIDKGIMPIVSNKNVECHGYLFE